MGNSQSEPEFTHLYGPVLGAGVKLNVRVRKVRDKRSHQCAKRHLNYRTNCLRLRRMRSVHNEILRGNPLVLALRALSVSVLRLMISL